LGHAQRGRGLYGQIAEQFAVVAGIFLVAHACAEIDEANQFTLADEGHDKLHTSVAQDLQGGRG
jgi:hypothetical protein